jgi:hypothetical protein
MLRMSDVDAAASEAARALVQRRWGTQRLDKAVELVVERAGQLSEAQRAELRQVAELKDVDGS